MADNGIGFSEEALNQLRQRFEAIRGDFKNDTKEHIGVANIFERLWFHYRDKAIFNIENLKQGGCRITIGGLCREEWR